jgi:uncharacterized protein (TIGR02444 family)
VTRQPRAANPFWRFSLRIYRRPGVANACIALQDRLGVDVNMLLLAVWTAGHGTILAGRPLAAATSFSKTWSTKVVRPLRAARRFLRAPTLPPLPAVDRSDLRPKVARAELRAERIEQAVLAAFVPAPAGRVGGLDGARLAAANLGRYFAHAGIRPNAKDVKRIAVVLGAAFRDCDPAALHVELRHLFGRQRR